MSISNETIVIVPPEHLVPGNLNETFYGRAVDCPYCQGKGIFTTESTRDDCKKEHCSICGGSGEVQAKITIEWQGIKRN